MDCCQCEGIACHFDTKRAQDELETYREQGPDTTTRMLIDALVSEGVAGKSLLDVGGGVGAIQHALLDAGADKAVAVEASGAYLHTAQTETSRRERTDRIEYHHGNFVDLAEHISPADIVTLDRVLCCYHDMDALVRRSAERARQLYGLVYPRDTWWMKTALAVRNVEFRLRRSPFRVYVHPTRAVDALLREYGFEQCSYDRTMLWQVVVYRRRYANTR